MAPTTDLSVVRKFDVIAVVLKDQNGKVRKWFDLSTEIWLSHLFDLTKLRPDVLYGEVAAKPVLLYEQTYVPISIDYDFRGGIHTNKLRITYDLIDDHNALDLSDYGSTGGIWYINRPKDERDRIFAVYSEGVSSEWRVGAAVNNTDLLASALREFSRYVNDPNPRIPFGSWWGCEGELLSAKIIRNGQLDKAFTTHSDEADSPDAFECRIMRHLDQHPYNLDEIRRRIGMIFVIMDIKVREDFQHGVN